MDDYAPPYKATNVYASLAKTAVETHSNFTDILPI